MRGDWDTSSLRTLSGVTYASILQSQGSPVHMKTTQLRLCRYFGCELTSIELAWLHSLSWLVGNGQDYLDLIGPRHNTDFIIKVESLLLIFSPLPYYLLTKAWKGRWSLTCNTQATSESFCYTIRTGYAYQFIAQCCTESKARQASSNKQLRKQPQRQCAPWLEPRSFKWLQQKEKGQKGKSLMNRSNSGAPQGVKPEWVCLND